MFQSWFYTLELTTPQHVTGREKFATSSTISKICFYCAKINSQTLWFVTQKFYLGGTPIIKELSRWIKKWDNSSKNSTSNISKLGVNLIKSENSTNIIQTGFVFSNMFFISLFLATKMKVCADKRATYMEQGISNFIKYI